MMLNDSFNCPCLECCLRVYSFISGAVVLGHHNDLILLHHVRWVYLQGDNKGFLVCKKKMVTSAELLCRYTPPAFRQVTNMHLCLLLHTWYRHESLGHIPISELILLR